ncbi:ARM repeat-containing protein [Rickenella mellea]|uniref:ARM repeat-containing protein n=1 Tax=Rickenella mellea TaxID=50990 RepID=A0A4Y7Q508_9AGAM|nr:ARM repeat-containing protein [Rickenella mellea]
MDPNFVQGLHDLLVQATLHETAKVNAATMQLNKEYFKNEACIPALTQIIASPADQGVKQLAAVELRKRIMLNSGDLWIKVPQADRDQIKRNLPDITLAEPVKIVRHQISRVISAIASIEIPLGQWPELLPFLHQCATSAQVAHREVGVYILYTVLENIVEGFQEYMQTLFKLFTSLVQDPESADVRVTTVRALGVIAQYIDADDKADIKAFQSLLPGMIVVLGQCLDAGEEGSAREIFDVFETLLILEIPLLGKNIPELVQFFLQCGGNRNYTDELRVMALNALSWTVKYKKSKIQQANLAAAILGGLMPITTETEADDLDDEVPSRAALRIIDSLATNLPPQQVYPALHTLVQQYMSSADPSMRRGAMLALGVVIEGCSEFMTPLMAQVWPLIEAGLGDADPTVRRATCTAVACLCEWLEEECLGKHAALVPAIMAQVEDPQTQREACTALDALLEILHTVIDQYLHPLMERLVGLLDTAPNRVKAVVTGAIGSAAHASRDKFLPYFQPTMEKLKHFLVLTGEGEEVELRGITMDAVGTFADSIGKEAFRPYFPDMMKQAFAGIEMGNARLRECSFLFFGVMARVYGEEFAAYLPSVVPALLESCKQTEHGEENLILKNGEAAALFGTGESPSNAITITEASEADLNVEDLDSEKMLEVNSAIAVEKEIAADTLGTVFANTRSHFLPYVEQSVIELIDLLNHYYEGIRKAATDSLFEIIQVFYELSDPQEWQAGKEVKVPLHQNVKDLIGHILPPLFEMYESEDDKSVVSALCVGFAETLTKVGPGLAEGSLDVVSNIAIQILEQKALCQQDPDQDESEEPLEDQAEYDSVLISSAGDVVAALANVLGADFSQAFNTFRPLISKYYKKSRSLSDRSACIGCLAEIIAGMKAAITPYTEPLLELFYRALGDEEAEVASNAAFAAGLLVLHSEIDLSGQYLPLLAALRPLFAVAPDAPAAKLNACDNAAGAVSRMIVRNTAAVPLDQVLPVLIGVLPLKSDFLENRPVFRAIFHLFRVNPTVLVPYVDQLLPVFAHVLDPTTEDQIGDEVRGELINLVNALNNESPAKIQAAGLGPFVSGA